MPKAFNADAERNHFALPPLTRQQIQALILDLDCDARTVIILAVQQLWQREIGEPDAPNEVEDLRREINERLASLEARLGIAGE